MENRISSENVEEHQFFLKSGWAKVWIEAEHPMPENWRSEFYKELVSEDLGYKKELEQAIRVME